MNYVTGKNRLESRDPLRERVVHAAASDDHRESEEAESDQEEH